MTDAAAIESELNIAQDTLKDLVGEDVDAIEIKSVESNEAPFLARIVSKLSPMVGNLMEQRIASILNRSASEGFEWHRQDPGFPDAVLVDAETREILAGYEIKAWFVLSTEITGRFRESVNLLLDKKINVVIVAWCMSNLIFGEPKILGTLIVSGEELARSRDAHYHKPPHYLTIEPNDTSQRTANLQQSNVNGYRLQVEKSNPDLLNEALSKTYSSKAACSEEAQSEAADLMRDLEYRLDTNFAKIDRVANLDVENFKQEIMESKYLGKTISSWKTVFSNLTSSNSKKREAAEATLSTFYHSMKLEEPETLVAEESRGAH